MHNNHTGGNSLVLLFQALLDLPNSNLKHVVGLLWII